MTGRGAAARWTIHGSAVMGVNLKISRGRTHPLVLLAAVSSSSWWCWWTEGSGCGQLEALAPSHDDTGVTCRKPPELDNLI